MATGAESKGSVARVREPLARLGLETEIKEFDASTRTSADAAAAIGCTVAQIAKSVIFRARSANQPVRNGARSHRFKLARNIGSLPDAFDSDLFLSINLVRQQWPLLRY